MNGDALFRTHYEPGLIRHNINNVVLRIYTHTLGLTCDDPNESTEIIYTPRCEVDNRLTRIFSQSGESRGIAITSIVHVDTVQRLLFMLDCGLSVSCENELLLKQTLKAASTHFPALNDGMILRTQNSYHVIGFHPLTYEEWCCHMAQALLLHTPSKEHIADVRYVGHSLERGYGSLRISDYLGKETPDFVSALTNF